MDPVRELIKNAQTGDQKAIEKLVSDNQGLVWSIVRRYSGRGMELEDLFQIGSIGLLKAIRNFDFSFDTKLSTYAIPMISGEVRRYLRDDGLIKVSRRIKGQAILVRRAFANLAGCLGRDPTVSELETETGLSAEEIVTASCSIMPVESLEQPILQEEGQEITLRSQLADPKSVPEKADVLLDHLLLKDMLSLLNDDERDLIYRRYMAEQTQTVIAEQLGMTQVQVCRKEKKILHKLRQIAKDAFQ